MEQIQSPEPTRDPRKEGRQFFVTVAAVVAWLALFAQNLETLENFLASFFVKPSVTIKDFIQRNNITKTDEAIAPMETDPSGKITFGPWKYSVSYQYDLEFKVVLEKKTFWAIKNCRGQLDGLSDDEQAVQNNPTNLAMGLYDLEVLYKFSSLRDKPVSELFFQIACNGVISNFKKIELNNSN